VSLAGRAPSRGEIWFVQLPTDPPDKGRRPVLVVSPDARNHAPRATTLLVVPLSTTPARFDTHIALSPGETGLAEASSLRCEDITTVRKVSLNPPRSPLRRLGDARLREVARAVQAALGYVS
jgi:mRNA-degrading endonuclease toxin of MazEF toxin-antitoxin module